MIDYTALTLTEVRSGLEAIARETQATFGGLDARQVNWRPDEAQWSVAQCFDHLLTANGLMFASAEEALNDARSRSVWQRVPVIPGLMGRAMIRSQMPKAGGRKFTAPPKARPASSAIAPDIIQRFVEQHLDAVARIRALDEQAATRAIMTSPFVSVIVYSVLDGWRLVVAHDRRHFEQARRVTQSPEFPR